MSLTNSRSTIKANALFCLEQGWAVFPVFSILDGICGCGDPACPSPGKHPERTLAPNGLHAATKFAEQVERWFASGRLLNYGIRTGQASNLVVVDIDDKEHEGRDGPATWRRLLASYAGSAGEPTTVEAISGSGGRHLFFTCPPDVLIASGKDVLGPGIDIKAEGGYVVGDGSLHISTRSYVWETSRHPEDTPIQPLPEWLAALCRTRQPRTDLTLPRTAVTLDPLEIEELRSALACLSADDRDQWVQVGMMLHATGDSDAGFALWDQWSQTSDKYQAPDQRRVWVSFKDLPDGVTIASLYQRAHRVGWQRPTLEQLANRAGVMLPTLSLVPPPLPAVPSVAPRVLPPPNPLDLPLPGVLETIAQWSMDTAPHPVRTYAVAAAIAIGSVLAARRFATDAGNFSSLYILVVGKSGTGKEHVRTTIEQVLRAAEASMLIGPNGWTSSGAVYSGLQICPQQVAVIDEIGKVLAASSGASDAANMKDGVLTTLMELYGRLHAHAHPSQYSTQALSKKQQDEQKRRTVERPAVSVVGLTTPATWYEALKSTRIASGFLNRFLVLEADVVRGDFRFGSAAPVPDTVIHWAQQLMQPRADLDIPNRLTELGPPIRVTITPEAAEQFQLFRRECNRRADALEKDGLGELPMRSAEQAMRLGLIAALAEDATARTVTVHNATWAISLARWQLDQLIPTVQERMTDNPVHALRMRLLATVREAGERGLTQHEIVRSRLFAGTPKRERDDAMQWAIEGHRLTWITMTHGAAGGRPRRALVFADHAHTELELSA